MWGSLACCPSPTSACAQRAHVTRGPREGQGVLFAASPVSRPYPPWSPAGQSQGDPVCPCDTSCVPRHCRDRTACTHTFLRREGWAFTTHHVASAPRGPGTQPHAPLNKAGSAPGQRLASRTQARPRRSGAASATGHRCALIQDTRPGGWARFQRPTCHAFCEFCTKTDNMSAHTSQSAACEFKGKISFSLQVFYLFSPCKLTCTLDSHHPPPSHARAPEPHLAHGRGRASPQETTRRRRRPGPAGLPHRRPAVRLPRSNPHGLQQPEQDRDTARPPPPVTQSLPICADGRLAVSFSRELCRRAGQWSQSTAPATHLQESRLLMLTSGNTPEPQRRQSPQLG